MKANFFYLLVLLRVSFVGGLGIGIIFVVYSERVGDKVAN